MSRCFPFPPPGYEKKARTDDVDLLKKEKHREKKHKKEKRDKEQKDSKEKREKDRSEGKDREKKDRKEKHRDKKKDKEKDRDKDKDKSSVSDEKKLTGKSEGHNGEILGQKEKDKEKGKLSSSNEKRFSMGDNGEKLSQNSYLAEETKDSTVLELGKRISDGDRGAGNQSAIEKFTVTDRKKDEAVVRLVAKDIGNWVEGKEKIKDKRGVDRRIDGQGSRDEAESSGNTMFHNLPEFVQGKFEGIPQPLEKNIERTMAGKDKPKKKEGEDKRGDKRRDKDRDKKSQGKDKNRDKEKKKEEKVKENSEQKSEEQDKVKQGEKNNHIGSLSNKVPDLCKDSDMAAAIEGSLRKRKDLEANGFFHAEDIRPNKLPRPPHSSHPLVENGRVLEPFQTPMNVTSDRLGVASNHIVDKKKQKVNGIIDGTSVSASSMKLAFATAETYKVAKASMKPPHPDSKYLDQILSVPKMEEWPDFDDQEWLLGSNETQLKKPKVGDSGVNGTPQVWEEAVHIESADICALPYVIPY